MLLLLLLVVPLSVEVLLLLLGHRPPVGIGVHLHLSNRRRVCLFSDFGDEGSPEIVRELKIRKTMEVGLLQAIWSPHLGAIGDKEESEGFPRSKDRCGLPPPTLPPPPCAED